MMNKNYYPFMPKHDVADRSIINHNGAIIPNIGVYVRSGSLDGVSGSFTSSIQMKFDSSALRLRRVEVFHSGAASAFNVRIENSTPNVGGSFDPRNVVVCYRDVPGSNSYTEGIDQIEDLVALTDQTIGSEGKIYMKFMPFGSGLNSFKYLLFFESVIIYVSKDGEPHTA